MVIDHPGCPCPAWCTGTHGAKPPWQDIYCYAAGPGVGTSGGAEVSAS